MAEPLVKPVLMSVLKAVFRAEVLSMQTTSKDEAKSVMEMQRVFSVWEASGERLKSKLATVSRQDLKSAEDWHLDAPSIKESLRTAACVSVKPELATARRRMSVVNTCRLLAEMYLAVHV